jgi:N-formylglutamate deformylase
MQGTMIKLAQAQDRYSFVFNGRFKGGHITRFYGNPDAGVHAIQLEMAQCLYMNEAAPFDYRPDLAGQVQPLLRELLEAAVEWVRR